jgi:hypothetical protein
VPYAQSAPPSLTGYGHDHDRCAETGGPILKEQCSYWTCCSEKKNKDQDEETVVKEIIVRSDQSTSTSQRTPQREKREKNKKTYVGLKRKRKLVRNDVTEGKNSTSIDDEEKTNTTERETKKLKKDSLKADTNKNNHEDKFIAEKKEEVIETTNLKQNKRTELEQTKRNNDADDDTVNTNDSENKTTRSDTKAKDNRGKRKVVAETTESEEHSNQSDDLKIAIKNKKQKTLDNANEATQHAKPPISDLSEKVNAEELHGGACDQIRVPVLNHTENKKNINDQTSASIRSHSDKADNSSGPESQMRTNEKLFTKNREEDDVSQNSGRTSPNSSFGLIDY